MKLSEGAAGTEDPPSAGDTQSTLHRVVPAVLFLAVIANAAMVPLMPYLLATRLHWPLWQVGLYSFTVMAATILLNRQASRRVDRGHSLVAMCLIGAICQALAGGFAIGALGQQWLLLLTVPALAGGGATVPIFYAMGRRLAERSDVDLGRYNALLRVSTSGGWVIGPAVGFWLLGETSPEGALLFTSAFAVIGVGALGVLSRPLGRTAEVTGPTSSSEPDPSGSGRPKGVTAAAVLVFLFSFMHIVTTTSLPLLLVMHTGIPESGTGLVLAVKAIVEMAAILVSPWVQSRWGTRTTLTAAAITAVCAYVTFLLSAGWASGMAAAMLEGAYYGLFAAVGLTWMQSLTPSRLGWVTGMYMSGIYTGVLLGSPLSGVVAHFWLPGITIVSAATAVVALIVSRTVKERPSSQLVRRDSQLR